MDLSTREDTYWTQTNTLCEDWTSCVPDKDWVRLCIIRDARAS